MKQPPLPTPPPPPLPDAHTAHAHIGTLTLWQVGLFTKPTLHQELFLEGKASRVELPNALALLHEPLVGSFQAAAGVAQGGR